MQNPRQMRVADYRPGQLLMAIEERLSSFKAVALKGRSIRNGENHCSKHRLSSILHTVVYNINKRVQERGGRGYNGHMTRQGSHTTPSLP